MTLGATSIKCRYGRVSAETFWGLRLYGLGTKRATPS